MIFKFLQPRSRATYWSCTSLADWIRGTSKPSAETSEGWNAWHKLARRRSKIRYWIAEEGLDHLQDLVYLPADIFHSIRIYINNRWVFQTHQLTAHAKYIKRGEWRDVGHRILPCLFSELVDFVEVETAWHNIAWSSEAREKWGKPSRWAYLSGNWRNREAGLEHLNWAANLKYDDDEWISEDNPDRGKPTQQALNAQEILALYYWWTEVHPQRPDPHEASGWTAYCDRRRAARGEDDDLLFLGGEKTPEEREEVKRILDECREIERRYEEEDTEMLIRLIRVRGGLWT